MNKNNFKFKPELGTVSDASGEPVIGYSNLESSFGWISDPIIENASIMEIVTKKTRRISYYGYEVLTSITLSKPDAPYMDIIMDSSYFWLDLVDGVYVSENKDLNDLITKAQLEDRIIEIQELKTHQGK